MKNYLGKNALSLVLASGLLFGSAACSRTEKETTTTTTTETTADADEAYSSYRTYVEEAERDTAYVYDSKRDWNKEISDREAAYNERWAAVEKNSATYDANRKAEIEQLQTRYNTNWANRRETYTSYGRASTMRPELLSIEENATDLSTLTAANIRAAYENFVKTVENNKKNYTNADWQIVEQSWNELDDRKTGNTAERVGSDVKDATTSGAQKVGDAAKEGGSKVGDAARKVGSETKDLYKKGEDKVDGTKDKQ